MTGIGTRAETENFERNDEKDTRNKTETEVAMSEKNNTRNGTKTVIEFES